MTALPLSVLDLAMVPAGQSSGEALEATTTLARHAEAHGYHRIWVAEHHNMDTVASTSPPVLMAHLAAKTERIRIGSGGVMLPNHAPLVVAEQFALLEAMNPGRIDLGVGRAPGTDRATALALRGTADNRDAEDFPRHLLDVMGLLGDARTEHGLWEQFRATPQLRSSPLVVLLGSSGFSAQLAGVLGLPFAFAHHFDMGGTIEAVSIYREYFEPSTILDEPYVIVTASAIASSSTSQAEWLAGPSRLRRFGMRSGQMIPLLSPAEASMHEAFPHALRMPSSSILGTADDVVAGLAELAERTGASELMLYTATHGLEDRLESLTMVAEAWAVSHQPTEAADPSDPTVEAAGSATEASN